MPLYDCFVNRYAKVPEEPLPGIKTEKSSTASSGSESSSESSSESDDSEAERVRKLALLQEQVFPSDVYSITYFILCIGILSTIFFFFKQRMGIRFQ